MKLLSQLHTGTALASNSASRLARLSALSCCAASQVALCPLYLGWPQPLHVYTHRRRAMTALTSSRTVGV